MCGIKLVFFARIGRSLLLIGFAALCVAMTAEAQTLSVLYTFNYPGPIQPASGVTMDAVGNLYGTTLGIYGGEGAVYKLSEKAGGWVLSPLLSFDYRDGNTPLARPIFGPDGLLYGTTVFGGEGCDLGCGNVYSLQPPATACRSFLCYWTGVSIYDFGDLQNNGAEPLYGDLLFDRAGNIYGTTYSNSVPNFLWGTVFELSEFEGTWNEATLHQFGSEGDGNYPASGVIRDQAGNLYGTTTEGGASVNCNSGQGCGTIYQLTPSGSGWSEQVLYSFQGQNDGDTPVGGLVMDS
jgi:uncharacterized repeat protein (TIGR03803 family)